jgi:hypothetical protein
MRVSRPTAAANNRRYQRFVDLAANLVVQDWSLRASWMDPGAADLVEVVKAAIGTARAEAAGEGLGRLAE